MAIRKDRLKLDKIWLRVKRDARLHSRQGILPKEITKEIGILKEKLLESNLESLRKRYVVQQEEWGRMLTEREQHIMHLKQSLDDKERSFLHLKDELEKQHYQQIEKLKEEYQTMLIKQKEEKIRKDLYHKEINIYESSASDLRNKIEKERDSLEKHKDQWMQKEDSLTKIISQKEEELGIMREELIEKENRYYHQQAQTEGELDLLRKELARLRNLLSLEQSSAETTIEQAKENVLSMQQQLEKIQEQMKFHEHLKGIDNNTLTNYVSEIKQLKEEKNILQESFDQERVRWKELWERERSTWEKRKKELREWEDRLRYERERFVQLAWSGKAPVPHYEPARKEGVGELPQPPLPAFMKVMDKRLWVRTFNMAQEVLSNMFTSLWFYALLTGAVFFSWVGYNIYLTLQAPKNMFYPSLNPKSVYFYDKELFLFMNASQKLSVYKKNVLTISDKEISIPEGVTDFVVEDRFLWTLADDNRRVSLRFLNEPDTIQGSYYLDEEAKFIAWDGETLWSLNLKDQRLNKHSIRHKLKIIRKLQLSGINPGGMSFYNGKLWLLDRNTKSFIVYDVKRKLKKIRRFVLPRSEGKFIVPTDFGFGAKTLWMVNAEFSYLYMTTYNRFIWDNYWR
ncbi:MAG: hypothetical protein ABII27_02215 [bacterium]